MAEGPCKVPLPRMSGSVDSRCLLEEIQMQRRIQLYRINSTVYKLI
jgi:hypothetical protein